MSSTSALPARDSRGSRLLPAYRAVLEDQWRLQVAEIIQLSYAALDRDGVDDHAADLEVTSRRIAAARQRLGEIEAALARVDDGSYGRCGSCGEPITAERLEVLPAARYCVGCQAPPHGRS